MSMKKCEIVKKILLLDNKYHVDYLMCWRTQDLENYLRKLKDKIKIQKEKEIDQYV